MIISTGGGKAKYPNFESKTVVVNTDENGVATIYFEKEIEPVLYDVEVILGEESHPYNVKIIEISSNSMKVSFFKPKVYKANVIDHAVIGFKYDPVYEVTSIDTYNVSGAELYEVTYARITYNYSIRYYRTSYNSYVNTYRTIVTSFQYLSSTWATYGFTTYKDYAGKITSISYTAFNSIVWITYPYSTLTTVVSDISRAWGVSGVYSAITYTTTIGAVETFSYTPGKTFVRTLYPHTRYRTDLPTGIYLESVAGTNHKHAFGYDVGVVPASNTSFTVRYMVASV